MPSPTTRMVTVAQAFALALQHHQAGRLSEAETLYRQILAVKTDHAGALHYLGILAHQGGRNDLAVELIGRAVALDPNDNPDPAVREMALAHPREFEAEGDPYSRDTLAAWRTKNPAG